MLERVCRQCVCDWGGLGSLRLGGPGLGESSLGGQSGPVYPVRLGVRCCALRAVLPVYSVHAAYAVHSARHVCAGTLCTTSSGRPRSAPLRSSACSSSMAASWCAQTLLPGGWTFRSAWGGVHLVRCARHPDAHGWGLRAPAFAPSQLPLGEVAVGAPWREGIPGLLAPILSQTSSSACQMPVHAARPHALLVKCPCMLRAPTPPPAARKCAHPLPVTPRAACRM